jgi:hypothetical protein
MPPDATNLTDDIRARASQDAAQGDAIAELLERGRFSKLDPRIAGSPEFKSLSQIIELAGSWRTVDLGWGFEVLKNSYSSKKPLGTSRKVNFLKDAFIYLDEKGNPKLIAYTSKASVNQFAVASLQVAASKDPRFQDPRGVGPTPDPKYVGKAAYNTWYSPGIVISQTLLSELGAGSVKAGESVLPMGSLGLVRLPAGASLPARVCDAGPYHSAGEVTVDLAKRGGFMVGTMDKPGSKLETIPFVDYLILFGTATGGALAPSALEPAAIETATRRALMARLLEREEQLIVLIQSRYPNSK